LHGIGHFFNIGHHLHGPILDILDKSCIFPYFVIWKMAKDEAVSNYPSIQWWKNPLNWTFARSIQFHKCWSFNEHWIARSIYWLVMI
jgi:hypothetical protein